MATYTIWANAFEYSEAGNVENPENAYDSSATTYATVDMDDADEHVYLYSFNFSKIPQGEVVTSITAKVKSCGASDFGDCLIWLQSTADGTGVKLSADMTPATSVSTKTLSLTADVATIMSYANTLSFAFYIDGIGGTFDIYAAYFTVTTSEVKPNKIIYGNETLIDLTSDTATASDVAVGKTFHLASGEQATGTLSMNEKFMTRTSTTLSVTGLGKLPDWFIVVPTVDNAGSSPMLAFFLYDGTNTYTASSGSGNIRINQSAGMRWSMSFSSGTLTLTKGSNSGSATVSSASKYKIYYL